ncbi:site-specific DNA recombinase [Clostridium cavendishii DSM 21758]|uniref:Site-specific DNA recombinase n=1 Tax=Clostridium cavendishii DSM 21758 TaxID=1121302 RepID=A0A1M6K4W6_9CLOT|nr:recombinase family protein [Clostridium cavendishii]SHJ53968.1 site-specific DNA recombinase [Clostridium cavendishii DSM 21758]
MKRVALYCRVSSDDQKERDTIENQVEILNTYIELKEDLEIFKEYLDNGVSGTIPFGERPGGKELLEDAKNKLFDAVLVYKIDRFGRDTLSGLNAAEILTKLNIEILSVSEPFDLNTPTGKFQFTTYLSMAELERNNILDRMYIGATRAAKMGKWLGGVVPYGYLVNSDGYLEINESEAKVIRKIFNMYVVDKISTLGIATYLNTNNIPSYSITRTQKTKSMTGKWRTSSVLRIISNTTYKGVHEYGKKATRRKETIIRKVPALISEELWNMAQKQKKQNSNESFRCMKNREYLLRGLIRCGHCGKIYCGISYKTKNDVYACNGKRSAEQNRLGFKCTSGNILVDEIEQVVWNDILHFVRNYKNEIENIKNNDDSNNLSEVLNQIKKNDSILKNIKSEKNEILKLYRKKIITDTELEEQLSDINKEENNMKRIIATTEKQLEKLKSKDKLLKELEIKLEEYNKRIDSLNYDEKRDLLKIIVKEIIATTVIEGSIKKVTVRVVYNWVKLDILTDMDYTRL